MDSIKSLPEIREIKSKLTPMTSWDRLAIVIVPLLTIVSYFIFAMNGWYVPALLSLIYLSFVTYGSCCHDLVHCNFGWSRKTCSAWLSIIELLLMRSGTTYKVTHLNHHQHYPDFEKDPEGQASYFSLFRTLLEGPILHGKLVLWTLKNDKVSRKIVFMEVIGVLVFLSIGILAFESFPYLLIYQGIVIMGSWAIPLITSYLVHDPKGQGPTHQTKIYRGKFFRILAMDHLYHLEHHLYPQIPHCRWKELALILNPYFIENGLTSVRIGDRKSKNLDIN